MHFGSLLAAVASYLQARIHDGRWLIRVEDIDPPRAQAGATDLILAALDRYGFQWDGPVTYQSESREAHDAAVTTLLNNGQAYPCGCSRRDLVDAQRGPLGTIYPGYCRDGCDADEVAIRVRTTDGDVQFQDGLQGLQSQQLLSESGDFIILRRDGLIAYQLAVVVDDFLQEITEVVRGLDLMDSTPRQLWLQRLLGYPQPDYVHIPVAINAQGQKLSKSHGAGPIPLENCSGTLFAALQALGQQLPQRLIGASLDDLWAWAHESWCIEPIKGHTHIP